MTTTQNTKTDFRITKRNEALARAAAHTLTANAGGNAYYTSEHFSALAAQATAHAQWIDGKIANFPHGA
jgi:hypothetical protein